MRPRTVAVASVLAAALVGGSVAGTLAIAAPTPVEKSDPQRTATVPITKGDLVDSTLFAGSLGYGASTPLEALAAGTLTSTAGFGTIVRLGETLYTVDEHPVVAFRGTVPVHRTMSLGMSGQDVLQLNRSLRALGHSRVPDSSKFTAETAAAVRAWEHEHAYPETGTIGGYEIAFLPSDVRIAGVTAATGAHLPGTVLDYSSTKRVVSSEVSARDASRFVAGAPVTATLASGRSLKGHVAEVRQASDTSSGGSATPRGSGSGSGDPTVTVEIVLDESPPAGTADQSVDVHLPGQSAEGVLTVPVSALVVAPGGGYRVETSTGFLAVETGLFADGRVAITGAGVREGLEVVVPA